MNKKDTIRYSEKHEKWVAQHVKYGRIYRAYGETEAEAKERLLNTLSKQGYYK